MLLAMLFPGLNFWRLEHDALWQQTVEAPSPEARSKCVLQWIEVVSATVEERFTPHQQDDFDRFARPFAALTTGFAAVGGDLLDAVVCGPLGLPNYEVRGYIMHTPGHWSAYSGAPDDELRAKALSGGPGNPTVYCIAMRSSSWVCGVCTFENTGDVTCAMCGTPH